MRSFETGFLERQPITHGLLLTVRALGEYRGKQDLYRQQIPQALDTLRQVAIIQSTESSNRIEGVMAAAGRVEALVSDKTTPRNRSEQEIAGYRDVLRRIHDGYEDMLFAPDLVLRFHREMSRYAPQQGGHWKSADNQITQVQPDGTWVVRFDPVAARDTPASMERLHAGFQARWGSSSVDRLLLIPAYVLDFLCIHPFSDGNGRVARLLALLLLYQAGYEVGRFVSLERIIEQTKEGYYDSLHQSSQGWHEGRHSLLPWTEYFLGTLLAAYREFEERVGVLTGARGAKTEMILDSIERLPDGFRISDLERLCPGVTRDMIRVVLNRLRKQGDVWCEGAGRGATWRKRGNNP